MPAGDVEGSRTEEEPGVLTGPAASQGTSPASSQPNDAQATAPAQSNGLAAAMQAPAKQAAIPQGPRQPGKEALVPAPPAGPAPQQRQPQGITAVKRSPQRQLPESTTLPSTSLHMAAIAGDAQAITRLLAQPDVDVNAREPDGATPLHCAAAAGHLEAVKALSTAPGCLLNALDGHGRTALLTAIHKQQLDVMHYLNNVDRSSRHFKLHWAAQHGHLQAVQEVLAQGAPPDLLDENGISPMHRACKHGHLPVVKELLQTRKVKVSRVTKTGWTPVLYAAASGAVDVIQTLLQHVRDKKLGDSSMSQRVTSAQEADAGLDVLLLGAKHGHTEVVRLALNQGANLASQDPLGNHAMHLAAIGGTPNHLNTILLLLERGAKHDEINSACFTPLLLATDHTTFCRSPGSCSHPDIVKELVRRYGWASNHLGILAAAHQGNLADVQKFLRCQCETCKHTPAAKLQSANGSTALLVAAQQGHVSVVEALLSAGADVNAAVSGKGTTPLMLAAKQCHPEVVRVLLEAGAKVYATDVKGNNPLHRACMHQPAGDQQMATRQVAVLQHLLAAAAKYRSEPALVEEGPAPDTSNMNTTMLAPTGSTMAPSSITTTAGAPGKAAGPKFQKIWETDMVNGLNSENMSPLLAAVAAGNTPLVAMLLQNVKVDVTVGDKDGGLPLHVAARTGQLEVVKLLIAAGSPVLPTDNQGDTPLHEAAAVGHLDVMTYLLKAQDDNDDAIKQIIDTTNELGWTPLHAACEQGQADMLKLLMGYGADPMRTTGSGAGALSLPRKNAVEIAKVLLEVHKAQEVLFHINQANWSPVILAVIRYGCEPDLLPMLLDHMESCWSTDEVYKILNTALTREPRGYTPLHLAVAEGHLGAIKLLLESGKRRSDVHVWVQAPALHVAADKGHKEICELLLEAGADVNAVDSDGCHALVKAVCSNQVETAELLLAAVEEKPGGVLGALQWMDRSNGFCPIHYGAMRGNIEAVQLLESRGQDLEQRTRSGRTPLEIAAAFGQDELVEYLLQKNCSVEAAPRPVQPVKLKWHTDGPCRVIRKESRITIEDGGHVLLACPMPASRGLSYVEVTVGQLQEDADGNRPTECRVVIGIGVNCYQVPPAPGQVKDTFGYDGSTGMLHWRSGATSAKRYGPRFGTNDTIGVLLNRATRTISFTRNAVHLGLALSTQDLGIDLKLEQLCLLVEAEGVGELEYNLGQDLSKPFLCSVDDIACEEEELHAGVNSETWRFKERLHAIHLAACSKSAPVLRRLLEAGAVVNQEDADGWTPLHFAALAGWSEGIEVLLTFNKCRIIREMRPGQPVDAEMTPAEATKHAVFVNRKTKSNSSPLRFTVKNAHIAATRILITQGGADCLVTDSQSRSLLMLAASTGQIELMDLLIKKGVAVKSKDAAGRTALQYAGNAAAAEYLEKQSNETIPYPGFDHIELRVDASIKQGAVGCVMMGKLRNTGEKIAIKFHSRQDLRDASYKLLTNSFGDDAVARKYIACVPQQMTEAEAKFDDPEKCPGHPFALVLEGGDQTLQEILDELGPVDGNTVLQLPENECRFIFGCLVSSVQVMHMKGYTHHDLKPANFVRYYDGKYKLIDFDNTRQSEKEPAGNTTPEVCSPEYARYYLATKGGGGKHKGTSASSKAPVSSQSMDMWALGCMLYQLVTRRSLVADLAGWDLEEFKQKNANDAMKVWAQLKEDEIERVVKEFTGDSPLQQAAQELILDLLKIQPGARLNINQVANSTFMGRGIATLKTLEANLNKMDAKIDTVVTLVTDIKERMVSLADLPAQLQAGFCKISGEINSFRKMVLSVHKAVCPATFIIGPDLPLNTALDPNATAQELNTWTSTLSDLFSGKTSMREIADSMVLQSYRLHLVCESCGEPQGDGYIVKKPKEWVPKMLPAMQISLTVAKIANVGLGIASIMFPGVPQIPDGVFEAGDALVGMLSHKSSAEDFACVQDALDGDSADGESFQKQMDAGLRQLAQFLATVDPSQTWGGLALMDMGTGAPPDQATSDGDGAINGDDVLWVCKACLTGKCSGNRKSSGGEDKGKGGGLFGRSVSKKEGQQSAQIQALQARVDGLQKYIRANGLPVPTANELAAMSTAGGASSKWDASTVVQVLGRTSNNGALKSANGGALKGSTTGSTSLTVTTVARQSKGGLLGCFPASSAVVHPEP